MNNRDIDFLMLPASYLERLNQLGYQYITHYSEQFTVLRLTPVLGEDASSKPSQSEKVK